MTPVLPTGTPVQSYLDQAAEQIGTSDTNDFVHADLHNDSKLSFLMVYLPDRPLPIRS